MCLPSSPEPHSILTVELDRAAVAPGRVVQPAGPLIGRGEDEVGDGRGGETDARPERVDRAIRVNTRNYDYYYLCPELRRKRMIPVLTRVRARSVAEFGELLHHPGEEFIYVVEGRVEIHTEFYDPVVLEAGESIYIDSNMGHAYVAAEGCSEATVLGVCSSADDGLMQSLLSLHADEPVVGMKAARSA